MSPTRFTHGSHASALPSVLSDRRPLLFASSPIFPGSRPLPPSTYQHSIPIGFPKRLSPTKCLRPLAGTASPHSCYASVATSRKHSYSLGCYRLEINTKFSKLMKRTRQPPFCYFIRPVQVILQHSSNLGILAHTLDPLALRRNVSYYSQ